MGIESCRLANKIFTNGRWRAKLNKPFDGKSSMPLSHYSWLTSNPSFEHIPKGYVIHHLDFDGTNDDPSNLVLMQRHLHAAYHLKNKKIMPEVTVDYEDKSLPPSKRTLFFPITEPRIYQRGDNDRYIVCFVEKISGKKKQITIHSFRGRKFKTKEDAEWAKKLIFAPTSSDAL